jgi:hypothetical protein
MTTPRALWESVIFAVIRLSPLIAPAAIVPLPANDPIATDLLFKRWLTLLAILVLWNMTEGAAILWMKAKSQASDRTKGYLIVTILCGAITVAVLQYGRTLTSQGIFLLTLAALSVRGMSRSGWENGRPLAGFLGAMLGNSLIALASLRSIVTLLSIAPSLDWQSIVVAGAIGSSVAAVEASWYARVFSKEELSRWALPLYRVTLCLGPIVIATMGMTNQIPLSYALTSVVVLVATRTLNAANTRAEIPSKLIRGAGGIYLLFVASMMVCKYL